MAIITTPDGRELDVHVTGPGGGRPLVFHHGTPGAVPQLRSMQRAAHERGLRLVTYSRPGYGASTRLPDRSVADAAADVAVILDHLGADRALTAGWSGGGPHALATAALLPGRVAAALVIAGVGPYGAPGLDFLAGMGQANIEEFGLALRGAAQLRPFLEAEAVHLRNADAEGLRQGLASLLPEVDRAVLTGEYAEDMAANFTEALRPGTDGWLDDDLCFTRPWGFDLARITVPVFLWQGTDDLMVPCAHGEWLAAHIPGVTAHLEQSQGHLSIALGALGTMLDELAAA